jgi:hypothetical protein
VDVVVNMEVLDPESIKLKVDKNRISGDYMTLFIRKTGERALLGENNSSTLKTRLPRHFTPRNDGGMGDCHGS